MERNPSIQAIELRPTDLASIGSTWRGPIGPFSVLETPENIDQIDFENSALFDASGKLHENLADIIGVLADPRKMAGLLSVSGRNIIDLIVCHGTAGQKIALSSAGKFLWLQFPAPILPVVESIEQDLLDPEDGLPHFDFEFTVNQAFVFWGLIDLLHNREDNEFGKRFTVRELSEAFDRPMQNMELLAPYYRDCLQLPLPDPQEIQDACDELAAKELIGRIGQDYLPGERMIAIAQALPAITWHTVVKAAALANGNPPIGIQVWMLQGASGLGLMWYGTNNAVTITSLTKDQIASAVGQTLADPMAFFSGLPAGAGRDPAAVISAKVPVPANAPLPAAVYSPPVAGPKPKRTKWIIGCFLAAAVMLVLCLLALGILGLMAMYPDILFGP